MTGSPGRMWLRFRREPMSRVSKYAHGGDFGRIEVFTTVARLRSYITQQGYMPVVMFTDSIFQVKKYNLDQLQAHMWPVQGTIRNINVFQAGKKVEIGGPGTLQVVV